MFHKKWLSNILESIILGKVLLKQIEKSFVEKIMVAIKYTDIISE